MCLRLASQFSGALDALRVVLFTQEFIDDISVALTTRVCYCRRSDRLDWMYQGGMLAKQEADQRTEEAMMSGKPVQQQENAELNRVSQCAPVSPLLHDSTALDTVKVQAFSGLPYAQLLTVLQAEQAVMLPTFYSEDTPASANETWARLHSDPLFAVSLLHEALKTDIC